ncbi:MAG: archease [Candidatus Neomarinimicrobiota bacterium]
MTKSSRPRWEHFPHQADIGIRGIGATLGQAFSQAGKALTAVVTGAEIIPGRGITFKLEAADRDTLFYDWINQVIYLMAVEKMLFGMFEVQISGTTLTSIIWGETIDRSRHQPVVEVKAATFTELAVNQLAGGEWQAQCVVDV